MSYYKVLWRQADGTLRSLCLPAESAYSTVYKPGEWVDAPIGALMVFDDLAWAKHFRTIVMSNRASMGQVLEGLGVSEIWEVEVHNVRKYLSVVAAHPRLDNLALFWEAVIHHRFPKDFDFVDAPLGTVFAKQVMLKEKVE